MAIRRCLNLKLAPVAKENVALAVCAMMIGALGEFQVSLPDPEKAAGTNCINRRCLRLHGKTLMIRRALFSDEH
jgi:hypothetical protein